MWALLCPKLTKFEMGGGGWQVWGILVLSLIRMYLMNQASRIVQRLDHNAMTRDQTVFWRGFKDQCKLAVVACIHRQTYKYVENSLALEWRRKLTGMLHKEYFTARNYYAVNSAAAQGAAGALTASTGGDVAPLPAISDSDERITADAKEVATQLAHAFCESIYASTAGTFFAVKLGQFYGLHLALAPYFYLWTMIVVTRAIAPTNVGRWIGEVRRLFGEYKTAHQHLVSNSEAVAALQGAPFELDTLKAKFKAAINKARQFNTVAVWPNLVEQLAFTWLLRSFMSAFVVGPHIYFPPDGKYNLKTIEGIAQLKGDVGHQFVLVVQSMIAAGTTAKMLNQVGRISGAAGRVYELLTTLKEYTKQASAQHNAVAETEDIRFTNVDIQTPDGTLLVKDLTFSLKKGESLLLTGHNGAGKSSIFRTLGGLWEAKRGSIGKPSFGTHAGTLEKGGVYYLPQKPYNVTGTLRDQLCYPVIGASSADLSDDAIAGILGEVGLAYLAERYGSSERVAWGDVLSLGETQRLAIARLLVHEPEFAILDECTSAVTGDMERKLYEHVLSGARKTAYITISHRPVLRAYHDQLLTIGIGEGKWTLQKLNKADYAAETSRSAVVAHHKQAKVAESSPKGGGASGSPRGKVVDADAVAAPKASFKDFLGLLSRGLPRNKALHLIVVVVSVASQVGLKVMTTRQMGLLLGAVFTRDRNGFKRLMRDSVVCNLAAAVVEQGIAYLERTTAENMMDTLSKDLLEKYLRNNTFYKLIQCGGNVTDPQQRIAADLRAFTTNTAALIPKFIRPVVELCWFSAVMGKLIGAGTVGYFGAYLVVGGAFIKIAMPAFSREVARESVLEGHFKASHARVKQHVESIAFYSGGAREKSVVDEEFKGVAKHSQQLLWQTWKFNLVNGAIIREAPFIIQWLLRNEFSKKVSDAAVIKDGGAKLGRAQAFIFDATNQMFQCVGDLLSFQEHLENLYGLVGRITELSNALDAADTTARGKAASQVTLLPQPEALALRDVSIVTPNNISLAEDVTVEVPRGASLMVTGHNAIGKTSFFRVLGGLWPGRNGVITRPEAAMDLFLVPQQVFMPLGTLAEQITYPERLANVGPEEQTRLEGFLQLVGVKYLAARHGWTATKQWEQIFSLGEQQRVGMARLFYHSPAFGVLDECTSAVSVDVERKLYEEAQRRGITCITISQRLALTEFHAQELNFSEDHEKGWEVRQTAANSVEF